MKVREKNNIKKKKLNRRDKIKNNLIIHFIIFNFYLFINIKYYIL